MYNLLHFPSQQKGYRHFTENIHNPVFLRKMLHPNRRTLFLLPLASTQRLGEGEEEQDEAQNIIFRSGGRIHAVYLYTCKSAIIVISLSFFFYNVGHNLDPRAFSKMKGWKRPWRRLLSSALLPRRCIACFFFQTLRCVGHFEKKFAHTVIALIYSKTAIRGFESQPVPGPFPVL